MTPRKKKQANRAHLLRNASCVGSYISWSVSIPIQDLTVVYRQAEGGTDSALWLLRGDSHRLIYKMARVKIMHDKPACVQT